MLAQYICLTNQREMLSGNQQKLGKRKDHSWVIFLASSQVPMTDMKPRLIIIDLFFLGSDIFLNLR